jgi:hypothetical protein
MAEEKDNLEMAEPTVPTTAAEWPVETARTGHVDERDDMFDSPEEMADDSLMSQALQYLKQVVSQPYWLSNDDAMAFQDKHHSITFKALLAGTAAITIAISQLAVAQIFDLYVAAHGFTAEPEWIEAWKWGMAIVEFVSAVFAGIYVTWGVLLAVQKKWLLERHKAERLRFLKYRSLLALATEPGVDRSLKSWKQRVKREADEIENMDEVEMERWWKENRRIAKDDYSLKITVTEEELNQIMEYYKDKRLDSQIKYFFKKSERDMASDAFWKVIPPFFFVASIACAVIHIFISGGVTIVHHFERIEPLEPYGVRVASTIFIAMAALFPVFGAAIRTHRSANEFSRNTVRFHAVYLELKESYGLLEPKEDATVKLRRLWLSEERLESEHREWLRLMDEAEWYG